MNLLEKKLTARGRRRISAGNFALPGRRYPIHDINHARAALSMVAKHGTPQEQATVRAAVHRKYPNIGITESAREHIPGGRAAKAKGKFPKGQMRKGREVEHEHSPKNCYADEIARDHLTEFPDYYDRLEKMEAKAKKYWSKRKHKMHEYKERVMGESTDVVFANLMEALDSKMLSHIKSHGKRSAVGIGTLSLKNRIKALKKRAAKIRANFFKGEITESADMLEGLDFATRKKNVMRAATSKNPAARALGSVGAATYNRLMAIRKKWLQKGKIMRGANP